VQWTPQGDWPAWSQLPSDYIDPRHHAAAMWFAGDPANAYDAYLSAPGYRNQMTTAYEAVLTRSDVLEEPLIHHLYLSMHSLVSSDRSPGLHLVDSFDQFLEDDPLLRAERAARLTGQVGKDEMGRSTGQRLEHQSRHLSGTVGPAADLASERLLGVPLVADRPSWAPTRGYRARSYVEVFDRRGDSVLELVVEPDAEMIQAVFDDYHHELDDAMNEYETLRAIGRAVRNLQVLHAFDEGSSRLNLQLDLPMLLLSNGFQPVIVPSMAQLFSGGFSLDQIATALRWGQDGDLVAGIYLPALPQSLRPDRDGPVTDPTQRGDVHASERPHDQASDARTEWFSAIRRSKG
jgi:hypothetical protein